MEKQQKKPDLVAKLLDIFLLVWMFVFGCAIIPISIGLIWLASGVLVTIFVWIDKIVNIVYELRFTYQPLVYGVSVVFGVLYTICQWRRRAK